MRLTVATPEAMRDLGERLAAQLVAGDLVILTGRLGAGKTTLAQGIGSGLAVSGAVVSPTFVIARVHRGGRLPMVHVDAYRLASIDEVDDLDLDASLAESVTLVEWGEGLVEGLGGGWLQVRIERPDDDADDTRTVEITGVGPRWGAPELLAIAADDDAGQSAGR
jgi:tRNA threonylcarbamoyladenosine biosynthesis protein TsaE